MMKKIFSLQGKFIRINFDVTGYIVGANIETCILFPSTSLQSAASLLCFAFNPRIHWNAVKGCHAWPFLWLHPSLPLFQNNWSNITDSACSEILNSQIPHSETCRIFRLALNPGCVKKGNHVKCACSGNISENPPMPSKGGAEPGSCQELGWEQLLPGKGCSWPRDGAGPLLLAQLF